MREVDVVVVQGAAKGVLADPDIAPIPEGRERIRRNVRFDTNQWLFGPIEFQRGKRCQLAVRVQLWLGVEKNYQRRPVVQVGIEIPPLVATRSAFGSHTILEGFDAPGLDSEFRKIFWLVGKPGARRP